MHYYFKLHFSRLQRWLRNAGTNPSIALVVGVIVFVLVSKFLYMKTEYASWIYLTIATTALFRLSDRKRNERLKSIFPAKDYIILRIVENCLLALPFQAYFIYETAFIFAGLLIPIAILLAMLQTKQYLNSTIPTPFKKFPFEFTSGFRKSFWIVGVAYFIMFKAIQVNNYNLGLFGLLLPFLISMSYYQKPEPEYYVWIYTCRPFQFLKTKFATSVLCISILSFLGLLGIAFGFPDQLTTTLVVYLCGYVLLGSMVLAKYSSYPYQMNVPQGLLYALSILFPPLLVVTLWIFYAKSKKTLNMILEC